MADIYGSHFTFGETDSRQHGIVLANAGTSRMLQLRGSREGVTIFNKKSNRRYLIEDDRSSSPISFDVDIVTESGRRLESFEKRTLEKWLFNQRGYRRLYIDTDGAYEYVDGVLKRCYLNCRFVNPEKIEGNGGIVGYKATLEADSDMFWQDPTVTQFDFTGLSATEEKTVTVNVDTDFDGYVYPTVTLQTGESGGEITFANDSDDTTRITKFVDLTPLSSITMNGETNYISGGAYSNLARRNFIRLLDGENVLRINGDVASVEIEYSARRFM